MGLSYLDAYNQIKALEANGTQLPLPAPTDAILVGSVDARTGAFTWLVPTFEQTIQIAHPDAAAAAPLLKNIGTGNGGAGVGGGGGSTGGGGGRGDGSGVDKSGANPPINITVGVVATNCVNLNLMFEVTDVQLSSEPLVTVTSGGNNGINSESGSTGNVTIDGFPNFPSQGSRIFLNAGLAASSIEQTNTVTPPVSTFPIGITANGQLQYIHISILRPPVLGVGAFTIPALPVAIIYSPPQGSLEKNSNTFNDKVTYTRSVTTAYSTQNATKSAQAYQTTDILAKIADLASSLGALGAGLPGITVAGVGGGAGMAAGLMNVVVGPPGSASLNSVQSGGSGGNGGIDSLSLSDALKDYGSAWKAVTDILTGLEPQTTDSTTTSLTTETDNTMTLALTASDTYGSAQGLGPPDGDRFIWLSNVRALWTNANGDVGIVVLGFDGVMAFPGATLVADRQSLAGGGKATTTGLDAQTIDLLLELDPYYDLPKNPTNLEQSLIVPPRFTPASPLHRAGTATSSTGDIFSDANEQIDDTTVKTTSQNANITDTRPGWISVLNGADNVETTTTLTVTNGTTTDDKTDQAITNTITMYSLGTNDGYDMQIYYDRLFGTLMPIATNSPLLQSTAVQKDPGVPAPAST